MVGEVVLEADLEKFNQGGKRLGDVGRMEEVRGEDWRLKVGGWRMEAEGRADVTSMDWVLRK
jgi:hypothetical protein